MKKLSKLIAVILVLCICTPLAPVYADDMLGLTPVGRIKLSAIGVPVLDRTPEENIFEFGGQKFIVLDSYVNSSGERCYYVLSYDTYESRAMDYTPGRTKDEAWAYFEVNDEYNIAHWLNNEFLTDGGTDGKLPQQIIDNIEPHGWHTEPAGIDGYGQEYITEAKVALMSVYEFKKYAGKYGMDADAPNTAASTDQYKRYLLRTTDTKDYAADNANYKRMSLYVDYLKSTDYIISRDRGLVTRIRPVFWLKESFFKENKLTSLGAGIAKTFLENGSAEEISRLYTAEELDAIYPRPTAAVTGISGNLAVGNELEVGYTYSSEFEEDGTEFKWYASDSEDFGTYSEIDGAYGQKLMLTEDLQGKYIKAEVTVKSTSSVNGVGYPVLSDAVGYIYGAQQLSDACREILLASSDDILSVINKHNHVLGLDTSLTEVSDKTAVFRMLADAEFDGVDELRSVYEKIKYVQILNESEKEDIGGIISSGCLGLNLDIYARLTDKSIISDALYGKNFTSVDALERAFMQTAAVAEFSLTGRDKVVGLLKDYEKFFTRDLSGLSEAELGYIGAALILNEGEAYSDFASLDNAVSSAPSQPPITPGGGGSSGGGSSGGGSGGGGGISGSKLPPVSGSDKKDTVQVPEKTESTVKAEPVISFTDTDNVPWAKDAIEKLYGLEIINGISASEFAPEKTVTREEIVKMLVLAFKIQGGGATDKFADVEDGKWYTDYISAALQNGLVNGVSETSFGLGMALTRQDAAVMIYRSLLTKGYVFPDGNAVFSDSGSISGYAADAVRALSASGIVNGIDGKFEPDMPLSRAMAAKLVYNAILAIGGE